MIDRQDDARPYLEELLQLRPDFVEKSVEYIKPVFVTEKHVEMILDGLKKAGIDSVKISNTEPINLNNVS